MKMYLSTAASATALSLAVSCEIFIRVSRTVLQFSKVCFGDRILSEESPFSVRLLMLSRTRMSRQTLESFRRAAIDSFSARILSMSPCNRVSLLNAELTAGGCYYQSEATARHSSARLLISLSVTSDWNILISWECLSLKLTLLFGFTVIYDCGFSGLVLSFSECNR
jgi:hypothetical protein